jgi:rRNA processing protein Krr1/Pno1
MQITMDALESALAPIEAIGKGEITFDINGVPITLRVLLPEEDAEVQKFSSQIMGTGENEGAALEYLERFKMTVLSYAVLAIGPHDFRGVQFVETSEKLANGQTVKIPKPDAMRRLMARWSGILRSAVFRKYVELMSNVEKEAEKVIKFEPTDFDAEIERLERRLEQLKSERESANAEAAASATSRLAKAIVAQEDSQKAGQAPTQPSPPEEAPTPVPEAPATAQPSPLPARRQPISPTVAMPPSEPVPETPGAVEPVEAAPGAFVNPTRPTRPRSSGWTSRSPSWTSGIRRPSRRPSRPRTSGCCVPGRGGAFRRPRRSSRPPGRPSASALLPTWPPGRPRRRSMPPSPRLRRWLGPSPWARRPGLTPSGSRPRRSWSGGPRCPRTPPRPP